MGRESDQVIFCQWDVSGSEPQNIGIFPTPIPTIPCHLTKLSFLAAKRERCQKKMTQNNITGTTNDN